MKKKEDEDETQLASSHCYNFLLVMASRPMRLRKHPVLQQEQQGRAEWTVYLTKILVDSMDEQAQQGNKNRSSFTAAWISICDVFQLKTGLNWDKEQIKNQFSVLRKQFTLVSSLFARSDFSSDESTGAVVAADEIWDVHIQVRADILVDFPLLLTSLDWKYT